MYGSKITLKKYYFLRILILIKKLFYWEDSRNKLHTTRCLKKKKTTNSPIYSPSSVCLPFSCVISIDKKVGVGKKVNAKRECYTAPPEMENVSLPKPSSINFTLETLKFSLDHQPTSHHPV